MKKGLIIASGSIENLDLLEKEIHDHDYVICADGGIRYVYGLNVKIDAIIGDLDSVDDRFPAYIKENKTLLVKHPREKNDTDTELALKYLIEKGYDYITLVGATGTRMDHTLANIMLLIRYSTDKVKVRLIDGNNTIYFTNDYLKLYRKDNHYLSIIPATRPGVTVSLKGFYYSLENNHIEFGTSLGISNKIIDYTGEIHIITGEALVFESRD